MEPAFDTIFRNQQANRQAVNNCSAAQRISKLKTLRNAIRAHEDRIYAALQEDLQKSNFEAAVTELFFVYSEIDFAIKNLSRWMKPQRVGKSLSSFFASNRLFYEPKGVCLIISPWNYPFQLCMSPLVSAIAAGNCVVVKPSELSAATSKAIAEIISTTFNSNEVACIEGGADVSTTLLEFAFDHIFFTGSTRIGKVVMAAAAKNLSTITLELGGKSPTVIDNSADLMKAAEKIAWGKLTNCGQTCIAPDYVLVPKQRLDEFVAHYKSFATKMYFTNQHQIDRSSYGKIISQSHYQRLICLVNDAVEKGAKIDWGDHFVENEGLIAPVVLTHVPPDASIMQEEIFGPILPILTYTHLDEALHEINRRSKPLALYIFSEKKKNISHIIQHTSAGGTCVNDVLVHISNPKLPFGGINESGTGSSHGFFGFKNFSHERAVVFQSKLNFNRLVYPPYHGKSWVLKLLRKIM